jgi:hypothetical protein
MPNDGVITLVEVKYGLFLNQLIFHYTSITNGDGAITLGGFDPGSSHDQFTLANGEEIRSLKGRYGSFVDSIQIITSLQTFPASGSFGGPGGASAYSFSVPKGERLVGLFGRAGGWMDALGVVYASPVNPSPVNSAPSAPIHT